MMLTNRDILELTDWRQMLHRFPEVSGDEQETAARVVTALAGLGPDRVVTGLGGHGVAAIWEGAQPGESVLFRAELDARAIDASVQVHENRGRDILPFLEVADALLAWPKKLVSVRETE